jgi:AcrR family transcriptional regulator
MLQIITGKFFKSDDRHVSDQKGVLYSNYRWYLPIETCVGGLESLGTRAALTTYLYSFTNQIEKQPGNFSIVSVGNGEIIQQFRLLCAFGLRATFAEDRSWVAHLCRSGTVGQSDEYAPAQLLPRYFAPRIEGNMGEAQEFAALVEKTLSLSRSDFLSVMTALQAFNGALEVVGSSLDLAYSMLVYALESLSQKYIEYEPQWADFDDRTRRQLEPLLAEVGDEAATGIRAALLSDAHLKLRASFQEFICTHVEDSFFTTEAAQSVFSLQHCELRRAARNIYDVRSAYVHELTPLMHQLRMPQIAEGDVFRWEREPHLTFSGVVRLADHVIRTLIRRRPSVEKEDYNWYNALPGIVRLNLAPQYWIHQAAGFQGATAYRYFGGFLEHFLATAMQGESISNMNAVMEKIEQIDGQGKPEHRRSMLGLYLLYNAYLSHYPEFHRPDWEQFLEDQQIIVDQPCIEMMAARMMLDGGFPWTAAEGEAALTQYNKTRFHRGILHLPTGIEIALTVAVANQALCEGLPEVHRKLLSTALLNSAGRPQIQCALQTAINDCLEVDMNIMLPRKSVTEERNRFTEIAATAYSIFLKRLELGQSGDSLSDWLEAEIEITGHGNEST